MRWRAKTDAFLGHLLLPFLRWRWNDLATQNKEHQRKMIKDGGFIN